MDDLESPSNFQAALLCWFAVAVVLEIIGKDLVWFDTAALSCACGAWFVPLPSVPPSVFRAEVNSAIKTRERDHETLLHNKQKFKDLVNRWPDSSISEVLQPQFLF